MVKDLFLVSCCGHTFLTRCDKQDLRPGLAQNVTNVLSDQQGGWGGDGVAGGGGGSWGQHPPTPFTYTFGEAPKLHE